MKLYYNNVPLHGLGEVSIRSQSSQYSPDDMPQKEVRMIVVQIDFWEQTFHANYTLLQQALAAIRTPNKVLLWQSADDGDTPGMTYLNQTAIATSHDIPEDPNAWGVYQQRITITFRVEMNDLASSSTHLQATFKQTGSAGAALVLGNVTGCRTEYKSKYYSELRNLRERSTGTVTLTGEFLANTLDTQDSVRAQLEALVELWQNEVNGKDGTLTYGPASNRFFDKIVRVDAFSADVNQAVTGIKWSLTASYTAFPNEATYAAADFRVNTSEDKETGDVVLTFSGKIGAPTDVIALNKLSSIRSAVLAARGFTAAHLLKEDLDRSQLDADDGAAFLELSFAETYRKKASNILSYLLSISDSDDARTGLIQRVYSGSVTATASTAEAAYNAAVAKARELGDNKHSFRLLANLTRSDRQVKSDGVAEFVSLDFSFEYQLKGDRIFLEINSETASDTFGENTERVSGYVVARDFSAAQAAYLAQVRNSYNAKLIRSENRSQSKMTTALGSYLNGAWAASGQYETMQVRLDFNFSAVVPKPSGQYAIKYGVRVEMDYVSLTRSTSVSGSFFADNATLAAAEQGASNPLDTFLAGLDYGKRISSNREVDCERLGTISQTLRLSFSETYLAKLESDDQLIQCELSEEIVYSGTRWVFQPLPDPNGIGVSEPQDCGVEPGLRTVSGTVTAATETAAMAWVKKQHALPFASGTGGGSAPATRYEHPPRIQRAWDFLPLEQDPVARGSGVNATFVKVSFAFSETLVNHPYAEV